MNNEDINKCLNDAHIATFKHWRERWCEQHITNLSRMSLPDNAQLTQTSISGDVLVVGAGPSLSESVDDIRLFGGMIVSTTHALRLLLDSGVRPEAAVVIDAGDRVEMHLDGLDLHGISLWAYSWIKPSVVSMFESVKWAFDTCSPFWPSSVLTVPSHATCAHAAAKISLLLGADRVVLVGCDMAFDGDNTHWHGNGEGDHVVFQEVDGIGGEKVKQSAHFAIMKEHWDYIATLNKGKIVNCTKFGAMIKGAAHVELGDIVASYDLKNNVSKSKKHIKAVIDAKQSIWGGPISFKTVIENQEFAFLMDERYVGFSLDKANGSFNVNLNIAPGFRLNAIDCADRMLGISIMAENANKKQRG